MRQESRDLKSRLQLLRQFGVAEYTKGPDGSEIIKFRDTTGQELEAIARQLALSGNDEPELPDGVFDPRAKIAEINRKHGRS